MTNVEKAKERARRVFPCPNEDEQRRIAELAYNDACQWKDQQFKEQKAIDDKRIAELEAEVDQAVENRDYWKEQAIVLKANEKELIRESRDYWNRVLVSLGVNNYDCATYLAEYNKTMRNRYEKH